MMPQMTEGVLKRLLYYILAQMELQVIMYIQAR